MTILTFFLLETKRDLPPGNGMVAVPLTKSSYFNPFFDYPFFPKSSVNNVYAKPSDFSLTRTGKPTFSSSREMFLNGVEPVDTFFKTKKEKFLNNLSNAYGSPAGGMYEIFKRSALSDDSSTETPILDSSYFIKKKYDFMKTLFKTLNATASPETDKTQETGDLTPVTTKPTIVPPDFWFPFVKLPKTPKPPKPTKPPKAKKVLKDMLDTLLLQSLLSDLESNMKDTTLSKRSILDSEPSNKLINKKTKSKSKTSKVSSEKSYDCIDKLIKILNSTTDDSFFTDLTTTVSPTSKSKLKEMDYVAKLDEFFDFLIKAFNETAEAQKYADKSGKSKSSTGKKFKRSTFLDELLHRVSTPAPTTVKPTEYLEKTNFDDVKEFIVECCCSFDKGKFPESEKPTRSILFNPLGFNYMIPQYLYAAKMNMYLDKLTDALNAANSNSKPDVASDFDKRSSDFVPESLAKFSFKEEAIDMVINELSDLKNSMIVAFTDAIKAQKDAMSSTLPYYGPTGKTFKKPWGPKPLPTVDPVAPIQKQVDVLSEIFDKLVKVEKILIFTNEPENNSKLLSNLTEIFNSPSPSNVAHQFKISPTEPTENPNNPAFFLSKTREYLQNLYGVKNDT